MAKNTHAQEVATGTSDSYTEEELSDENAPPRITRAMLGGEPPSVGTDSLEPSSNASQSSEPESPNPQGPALTTENPSDLTDEEDSTVLSMDGNGQETETELSEEGELPPYSEWTYKELQAECKERDLPANGSTEELIARLEEFDELSDEDDDEDHPFE